MGTAVALFALLAALLPAAAAGKVGVKVQSDGSKLIYNETSGQRARRMSASLLAPRADIAYLIDHHARRHNLSPRLVQAVIQVESGYNARARSHKGAQGLMQLMPATARQLGVADPYDPDQNIRGGTRYLSEQLDRFSNLSLALAAYNAGPEAVSRYGGIPPYRETRNYVQKVLGLMGRGTGSLATPSPAMQEYAREQARRRQAEKQAATTSSRGAKVYLSRDENNRIRFTTAPPKPK